MDNQTQQQINVWLAFKWGAAFDNRPKYRLIWANNETEYRHGIFLDQTAIFDDEGRKLIIETETEDTRLCQKYNYCLDRWVLETLKAYNPALFPDLVSREGISYEPFYVFENMQTREYEEPSLEKIDQIIYFNTHKSLRGHRPTEIELFNRNQEKFAAIRSDIREKLDDAIPDTAHALVHGSAIVVPGGQDGKEVVHPAQQSSDPKSNDQ